MHPLAPRFSDFADAFVNGAPLYSRLARRVSEDDRVLDLMSAAPPTQRIPVLLFASAHYLLLDEPDHPLAEHYPNLSRGIASGDSGEVFVDFVLERHDRMAELLASRSTQTNELSRCNWFLFPWSLLETEYDELSRIDVGSSAGLTLLFPHLNYRLSPGGTIGASDGPIIECEVRGPAPTITRAPRVAWSLGLDAEPIDVRDDDAIRWLEACVWPEQTHRFDTLRSAVEMARRLGVNVERGDAVDDLDAAVRRARQHGHPVVTTSWVLNYLPSERRIRFVDTLDSLGASDDLSWIIAESPHETPELPGHGDSDEDITVITLVTWRGGRRTARRLATTHPHGSWVNWSS